jgi:hypothetical protein
MRQALPSPTALARDRAWPIRRVQERHFLQLSVLQPRKLLAQLAAARVAQPQPRHAINIAGIVSSYNRKCSRDYLFFTPKGRPSWRQARTKPRR